MKCWSRKRISKQRTAFDPYEQRAGLCKLR
nr:MAG TPA: hypothetical protein [Caudoviricetes sp.]